MAQKSPNIIFFGTSDFAQVILNTLIKKNYHIQALITQPDQPVGRKKIITPPPAKVLAKKNNIPVLQPAKLDEHLAQKLKSLNADLFILVSYGKIIPQNIINIPQYKTINIHPSLLPKYRGPAPIQTTLLNDEQTTGTTIILVDEKMDHGPIISQVKLQISDSDNYQTLLKKLADLSSELLIKTIPDYLEHKIQPREQNHQAATFTQIITKQDGHITSNQSAQDIYNMHRAYQPWPGIFGNLKVNNQQINIKLIDIELANPTNQPNSPLELFQQDNNLYLQSANHTALKINQLQPQGKNTTNAKNFINGYLK